MIAKVLVKQKTLNNGVFDYLVGPDISLEPLSLVEVPFRNKKIAGIVISVSDTSSKATKTIIRKLTGNPILTKEQFLIAKIIAEEFISSTSQAIFSFIPNINIKDLEKICPTASTKKRTKSHGVFVSGPSWERLNYYISLDDRDTQSLMVFPEIEMLEKAYKIYKKITDKKVYVWHSKVPSNQKLQIINSLLSGQNVTILSTRHGLFLPFTNIANLFIDQPTNFAHYEDQEPYYNAYKASRLIATTYKANLIIGDSMPDLISYAAIMNGKLKMIELTNNLNINLSGSLSSASSDLELVENLNKEKIALVTGFFKGFYGIMCLDCKQGLRCKKCDGEHFNSNDSLCLKCQLSAPTRCPNCQSINLLQTGTTSRKIESELKKYLPAMTDFEIKDMSEINKLDPKFRIALIPYFDFYSNFPFATFREKLFRNILELSDLGVEKVWLFGEDLQNQDFANLIKQRNWTKYLSDELKNRKLSDLPPFKTAIKIKVQQKRFLSSIIDFLGNNEHILSGEDSLYVFIDHKAVKDITKSLRTRFKTSIKIRIDPVEFA